ncbi:unnamed protein product [Thlaspi arvense]|uniref:Uncharacterized protein n=1 Tax=Thlaspi arvense TaxID=13288 RepID=A0AAU9S6S3_THLAR|nr:unnamed protein product [Thlaspi arvense]
MREHTDHPFSVPHLHHRKLNHSLTDLLLSARLCHQIFAAVSSALPYSLTHNSICILVATGPTAPLPALSPTEENPGVALTPSSSPGGRSGVGGGSKTTLPLGPAHPPGASTVCHPICLHILYLWSGPPLFLINSKSSCI